MKENLLSIFGNRNKDKIIKVAVSDIIVIDELKNAFHMDITIKDRIKEDMSINGFSKAHPIHIFRWEEKWVLCDGHTRYTAAKELELKHVWAQIHEFDSINQALLYSMKEQFNRRNIEDSELFKQFEILHQEEIEGRKLSADEMSQRLKKSKRHIFKLKEVFAKSSQEQLQAIREGNASINQVYNTIKKQEAEEQSVELAETTKPETAPEINDAVRVPEEVIAREDEIVDQVLPTFVENENNSDVTEVEEEIKSQNKKLPPLISQPKVTEYQRGYSEGCMYICRSLEYGKTLKELQAELAELEAGNRSVDSLQATLRLLKESHEQKQTE